MNGSHRSYGDCGLGSDATDHLAKAMLTLKGIYGDRITGGGSGIGRAIALKFAASGAAVRILDVSQKDAEAVAAEISDAGGTVSVCVCDVSNQQQVKSAFSEIGRQGPIHILVNNAGVSHIGNAESTSEEDFDRVLRVNVKGIYNCIHAAVGYMKASGGGILNMADSWFCGTHADRFAYSRARAR
jgi:NAD(P)-dependent dehydrogenase (short-subunit alcohol dehydrogenase family)